MCFLIHHEISTPQQQYQWNCTVSSLDQLPHPPPHILVVMLVSQILDRPPTVDVLNSLIAPFTQSMAIDWQNGPQHHSEHLANGTLPVTGVLYTEQLYMWTQELGTRPFILFLNSASHKVPFLLLTVLLDDNFWFDGFLSYLQAKRNADTLMMLQVGLFQIGQFLWFQDTWHSLSWRIILSVSKFDLLSFDSWKSCRTSVLLLSILARIRHSPEESDPA